MPVVQMFPHTQPLYSSMDFVRDNPGEPVPEETFTHSHLSWSSVVPYLLHPSNMIHGILPVQSTRLTVFFHNLSPNVPTFDENSSIRLLAQFSLSG